MKKQDQTGVTMIELMIVVAIIGILAAIGYPSYSDYVSKTRRSTDGTGFLMEVAQSQEQFASQNGGNFANTMALLNYAAATSPDGYYAITIATTANPPTFQLTATPTTVGGQDQDVCGALTLNSDSVQGSGLAGGNCWSE